MSAAGSRPTTSDTVFRPGVRSRRPRPDAVPGDSGRTPTRAPSTGVRVRLEPTRRPATPAARTDGPTLPRDRAILLRLARLRVLSLAELQGLVFPGRDRSRLSRRLTVLEETGWIRRWERPRERGGRFRFVVPTDVGLAWALRRLEEQSADFAHGRLLATMLRTNRAAPVVLPPGRIPFFLPHLAEANAALVALLLAPSLGVTWASSWPRPFPVGVIGGHRLPQPDGVVLQAPDGAPSRLLFLEHDRATESVRSFARSKVDRYRSLAARPALLEELTGFRRFSVLVTVAGANPSETDARVSALRHLVLERFAAPIMSVSRYIDLFDGPDAIRVAAGPGVPPSARTDADSRRLP